jgi:type IX secretion system PorP/SprF family membrane protein
LSGNALTPILPAFLYNFSRKELSFGFVILMGALNRIKSEYLNIKIDFMKLHRLLLLFIFFGIGINVQAQEIHYSLYNMSPLTLNPAQTGAFYGTVRVGGIFRSQWFSVDDDLGYETPAFYVDAPIIRGFREQDWVGVGGVIVNDRAGSLGLRNNATFISAAYHLGLGKKGNNVLTLGIQGGGVQRSFIGGERIRAANRFDGQQFGDTAIDMADDVLSGGGAAGDTRQNLNYIDFGAGLMFKSKLDKASDLELGVAVDNVNQPEDVFERNANFSDNEDRKPMRITAHARYQFPISDKLFLAPTALFQTQRGANEFNFQAWAGYLFDPEREITFNFGLGYRVGDAGKVLAGADIKDLRVAASFDLNVSQYRNATDYQGAFEIAAWYIIKKYKKPDVKPAILCPKF